MNMKNKNMVSYRLMIILALIVGIVGIALQFFTDFGLLSFVLTIAVLGGLISGSDSYEERDRQQLEQSYKKAVEWLLLIFMAAYAFIEFSRWFVVFKGAAGFLNDHWSGLILSVMCIAMGVAGLQKARIAGSA